jgi:hypothetical protein
MRMGIQVKFVIKPIYRFADGVRHAERNYAAEVLSFRQKNVKYSVCHYDLNRQRRHGGLICHRD